MAIEAGTSTYYQAKRGIVQDGLVLHLDAGVKESYSGGTTWRDLSGNGNDATLVNGPLYAKSSGGVIICDGSNDYAQTPFSRPSPSSEPTTYEIVFRRRSAANYAGLIGSSNYLNSGFSVGFLSGNIYVNYYSSQTHGGYTFSYPATILNHACFVFDGRTINSYKDGILFNTTSRSFDATADTRNIRIANVLQGGWASSPVDLYLARVYSTALSANEIQNNFNATRHRFGL